MTSTRCFRSATALPCWSTKRYASAPWSRCCKTIIPGSEPTSTVRADERRCSPKSHIQPKTERGSLPLLERAPLPGERIDGDTSPLCGGRNLCTGGRLSGLRCSSLAGPQRIWYASQALLHLL